MLYEKICSERQRLEQEIASLQTMISELPEGKLVCARNGSYTKWYRSDGHHSTYLPKKEKGLAEQLAVKKYLQMQMEELLQEKKAIDFYLRHHHSDVKCAEQLLPSVDKGTHASKRDNFGIFCVIIIRCTSSTPQSSALKMPKFSPLEVEESGRDKFCALQGI